VLWRERSPFLHAGYTISTLSLLWKSWSLHDRKKVGNCVAVRRGEHEKPCESPDLEIECIFKIGADVKVLGDSICAILFDPCNDEIGLFFIEKFPGLTGREFRKVGDEEVADNSSTAGDDPFELR
jgi:hypothetical protein